MFMVCLSITHSDRPRLLAQAAKGDAAGCTETLLTDLRLSRAGIRMRRFFLGYSPLLRAMPLRCNRFSTFYQ